MSDIIVDLRPGGPSKTLLTQARRDLWWLHEIDVAAIVRGDSSLAISILGQSSAQRDARLISQARVQSKVMVERTREFALEKALQLIRRELSRVTLTRAFPDLGSVPPAPAPIRMGTLFGYYKRVLSRLFSAFKTKLHRGLEPGREFVLRIGDGTPDRFLTEQGQNIPHPDQGWHADPFLLEHDGSQFCFFEDLPRGANKARISVAQVSGSQLKFLGSALEADYHLSFPFIFSHKGETYMLPETIGAERIEIWKSTAFPNGWELHATALDGQKLADPVLAEIEGEWWLFANPCNDSISDFSSELWLFRVDGPDLRGVAPHPLNPIVVGSDTARGGGRVMWCNGRLLRIAQDNSGDIYGYGLSIMEITKISATDYQEQLIRHIGPDDIPGAIGCHHIDFLGGRFVMDVRLP